ncbi:MAG: hypothetical protein DRN81_01255 [Thermoproteota archaeon]|nr:MAG: hypothetical protein DRN81_01255 [Candidatus Korarchaeota archaeon]
MPKIMDILGKVIHINMPSPQKEIIPEVSREPICAEMLTIYEWLLKYKGQAPFFCLMLQEGEQSSFLLKPDGEPAVFKDWSEVNRERDSLKDNNVWILEFEGVAN